MNEFCILHFEFKKWSKLALLDAEQLVFRLSSNTPINITRYNTTNELYFNYTKSGIHRPTRYVYIVETRHGASLQDEIVSKRG